MAGALAPLAFAAWWLFCLGVLPVFLSMAGIHVPYTQPLELDVWISLGVFF